jgi:hypothetical protein
MKYKLTLLATATLLLTVNPARADYLPKNFWVNPGFELGVNLNQTTGTVSNWNRGGGNTNICQVITNNSVSPTHSLAVIDNDTSGSGYGEWYSDVPLGINASEGDTLNIQWYEMYNLSGPEMRVTVTFFNGVGAQVGGSTHFVTAGTSSPGWVTTIDDSTFTKRNGSLVVPSGATTMRCSLVSGGSASITGVMVIDDLSVARAPVPNLLFGNFWTNSTFESGVSLDQPTGTPANWNRGGGDTTICQVTTNNFTSATHALAVIDTNTTGSGYGEWYSDVALAGNANPGDTLNIQWFEMYNISAPEMRLTVLFFDGSNAQAGGSTDFVTSGTTNAGWKGSIAASSFTKRNSSLVVPANAVKMRCSLVSGGSPSVTGVMIIDDLSVARVVPTVSGNFWVNSTFETGTSLDQPTGTPANWNRGGSDGSIDQVTTNNYISPTHALVVVDTNTTGYGEWYSDVALSGHANVGDLLDVQWSEMYGITNGQMRLSVAFLDTGGSTINQTAFQVSSNSAGWSGTIAGSAFVSRLQVVSVPSGAAKIRILLTSGGPATTVGIMVIDDLSVSLHPSTVLAGNFFPNPTFENGSQMDNPTAATPAGVWQRGGSDGSIDQVTTANSVSHTHSLSLLDNNPTGYGEWYGFLPLAGLAAAGDVLDFQWFQLYSVDSGNMRLSFAFLDGGNNTLSGRDFNVSGQSPGWSGSVSNSPFERQLQRLAVPAGATQLRVNFASGGASSVTGTMVIDDLSIQVGKLVIIGVTHDVGVTTLTWDSSPTATYTVLSSPSLGPTQNWTPLVTGLGSAGVITEYDDTTSHSGNAVFYRVKQE